MNQKLFRILFFLLFTLGNVSGVFARSLEQAAKDLESKGANLALLIAPFGIILAAVYMVMGKEEGKQKISLAIFGAVLIVAAKPIIQWLSGIFS